MDGRQRGVTEAGPKDVVVSHDADGAGDIHIAPPQTLQHSDREQVIERDQRCRAGAEAHVGGSGPLVQRRDERAETNDLDAETLDLLEDLLVEFQGTLLLVSHDREFLDNVVTSTLVFEGNGRIGDYVGGYADWVREKRKEGKDRG